ncbi:ABC transporter substrate-binding protein [Alsobacter metallidurans]|uniref:ABC transporter substrate-binding protein n=1 Tax=Alsobacter metallidurans TaxID=340221 RepID=A0A917MJB2_9HYPH|nr:ABC transporter substrate-binding protein [Alsobacter metallidurans]GGH30679.1 ABC transporter substrate-binding protein [Alsobacter metallidurans]
MLVYRALSLCLAVLALLAAPARAADKVTFGTNWLPQPEHGGFYQALADGTYARYGLDVTIVPGGPQVNNRLLLPVGKLDFYMGGNLIQAFAAVEQDIPTLVVAAMFQKEPQVLMAHPGQGFETLADLKNATLFLSKQTVASSFQWLKAEYGFRDEQVKPYAFSAAPFLADKRSAQQGYATSEPLAIRRQGGFDPKVFLLADYGFDSYATTIETRRDLVAGNPDLVRRFVEASILGWVNYLYGDNAKANDLIRKLNPDISEELVAFSTDRMRQDGIVDSGEALTQGVGAMTDARMASFYGKMVKAGVLKPGLDIAKAYSLAFVNKGVGMAEKARLAPAAGKP